MNTPDDALDALRKIKFEFREFCKLRGSVTEADTRAKVIDKILQQVLLWPENQVTRESHVDRGYMDYCLTVQGRSFVIVEAKKAGIPFVFPTGKHPRTVKLSGTLLTDQPIREAIEQVRVYCDGEGARYAIATNGYAWIVFRAIRDDIPWKKGSAIVFSSLDDIEQSFTLFWNLVSYNAISSGVLDTEFGVAHRTSRYLHRVVGHLFNADLPLQRNRLNAQLQPLIKLIFEDIADQDQVDILQSCYVHSDSLRIVTTDLNCVITDSIPAFLQREGAEEIKQGFAHAGRFGIAMINALKGAHGQLILLLGGIGSGKTTFLKRYQRTVGKDALEQYSLWFRIDFLTAPLNSSELELFIWQTILDQMRKRYSEANLENRANLKMAFEDKIKALRETTMSGLKPGSTDYEKHLSRSLKAWQSNLSDYLPRLLKTCQSKNERIVVLFIDNVDQLSPEYQAQVFLLAQRITRTIGSITIVSLREESYYAASIQKAFTAFTNRKFHIASPHFRRLIHNRIGFALHLLERTPETRNVILPSGIAIDKDAISNFLQIVEHSIFERNRHIAKFIEAICFGNMRMALQMFTTFLTSGATDVDKMLLIYNRDGAYFVAFHEFVKSVMLGDRAYYKEAQSPIMNLFDCGSEKNSSHFTALRVLMLLLAHRGESSREGQGYFEITRALSLFEDVFDNREDFIRATNRLIERQLAETNTRGTEGLEGASHIRVTSSGWYYVRFLLHSFPYLDLVLQDTPINELNVERNLRDAVSRVNNLGDKEEEKTSRMAIRFARVAQFLDYLEKEEVDEFKCFNLAKLDSILTMSFVPQIKQKFLFQKERIERRIAENRERFEEELPFDIPEEERVLVLEDDASETETPPSLPGI